MAKGKPKKVKLVPPPALGAPGTDDKPAPIVRRRANGTFRPGYSGAIGTDAARARRQLNLSTIGALQAAFDEGGRAAIFKVMRTQPAIFLKMLVLLVPRELEITQSSGTKGMSDEALEQAVQAIEGFLAKRAAGPGADARVIEASPVLPQDGGSQEK
jgi:hypothetical protein